MGVNMNTGRGPRSVRVRPTRTASLGSMMEHSDITVIGTIFFFCLTYVLLGLTDGLLVSQGASSSSILVRLKYPCMLATIACGLLHMVLTRSASIFRREFVQLFGVGAVFAFISAIEVIHTNSIGSTTTDDLLKLVLPVLMAYAVLNTLSFEQIQGCMVVVLLSSIVGYICELVVGGITLADLTQSSTGAASTATSSPLESSIFAGISITLCFYYCYYRSNKLLTILSVVYAIATFKRVAMAFAIVALILPLLINVNKKVNKLWVWLLAALTLVLTGAYYLLLQPSRASLFETIFGQSQMDFTTGRSAFLTKLLRNGFTPFGFGSSTDVIGRPLEMDLIQIALELTPIALVVFVLAYWNICRENLYCIIIMIYEYSNFITSHSLNSNYKWGICFILIGMITYMPRDNSGDMGWFAAQMRQLARRVR